jgi:hypothetical protein
LVEQGFAPGTLLPRGFFVVVGGLFILALLIDHWAIRLRLPTALGVLLLGLSANVLHNGLHHLTDGHISVETVMRSPLAPWGEAAVAVRSARTRAVSAVA